MKRILFETGHPGQVHQFRPLAKALQAQGHTVLFVTKDKVLCIYLLEKYGLPFMVLGKTRKGIISKILNIPAIYLRYFRILRSYRPDMILSRFTLQSSHLAWLLGIPHLGFTDSEHIRLMDTITVPFTTVKFTAHSYWKTLGKNHFRFRGNIELFYLHPNRFTPDPAIWKMLGLQRNEPYAIVRFISWNAYHDVGQRGLTLEDKRVLITFLSERMKVFISSEGELPEELRPFQMQFPPEKMHDALASASMYVGEGATMASEAAILGTPAVYINTLTAGSIEDAADAGLLYSLRDRQRLMEVLETMVNDKHLHEKQKALRDSYLEGMMDVTGLITWFVDQYPESLKLLKQSDQMMEHFRTQPA